MIAGSSGFERRKQELEAKQLDTFDNQFSNQFYPQTLEGEDPEQDEYFTLGKERAT